MMTCINVAECVLSSELEKDHGMIETRRLKNVAIFIQTNMHYTCIARITIDLVLRIDKKIIGKFI